MATNNSVNSSFPTSVTQGGTGLTSTTVNQILYSSASNTISGLATAINSILATNSSGVPSLTTSLPTAVQVSVSSLNTGTSASASTYWRGDGTWATPATSTATWNSTTGTAFTLTALNNYVANSSSLVTYTLPTTSNVGDTYVILGNGTGGWKVAQNASQNIQFGNVSTTSGTGGSLASTNQNDSVTLVCKVANSTWGVIGSQGNITVV